MFLLWVKTAPQVSMPCQGLDVRKMWQARSLAKSMPFWTEPTKGYTLDFSVHAVVLSRNPVFPGRHAFFSGDSCTRHCPCHSRRTSSQGSDRHGKFGQLHQRDAHLNSAC